MMHFSKDDWFLYANSTVEDSKLINDEKKLQMEEHLMNCDICMDTYISVCDNLCTKISSNTPLSVDFVNNIMDEIKNYDLPNTKYKKSIVPNMFLYYTAAACITLLLMRVNVFESLSNHIFPHTASNPMTTQNYFDPILKNNLFKNIKLLPSVLH